MTSQQFAFWLQGVFELTDTTTLNEKQVTTIKNHLKLVFLVDIDPGMSDDPATQHIMQNIHDGKPALEGIHLNSTGPQLISKPSSSGPVRVKC